MIKMKQCWETYKEIIDMLDNKEPNIVQIFVRPPMTQIYGNSESPSEDLVQLEIPHTWSIKWEGILTWVVILYSWIE